MNRHLRIGAAMAALVCAAASARDVSACDACGAPGVFTCDFYPGSPLSTVAGGPVDKDPPAPYRRSSSAPPVFNSRPDAYAQLFLDFDGVDFGSTSWSGKRPGVRPAYDLDGDPSHFSGQELANIEEVWLRVSEAFSMFDVNVTTVDPGDYSSRRSAHVVISGDNSWWGGGGGVGFIGGFRTGGLVRATAWVFPDNLRGGDPKVVADAATHEAGHLFGLQHQSTYDDAGEKTDEYDNNFESAIRAPTMGVSYNAARGLWAVGAGSSQATRMRDELEIMGSVSPTGNRFGFVPDEHGHSFATAERVALGDEPLRGVISHEDDVDYYRLDLDELTNLSVQVDVAPYGPNLDARARVYGPDPLGPDLIVDLDPEYTGTREGLVAGFRGALGAGTYYLTVASHGGFTYPNGPADRHLYDVGQYFLSAAVVTVPEPSALAALALLNAFWPAGWRRRH